MANMTTRTIASAAERIAASTYIWCHTGSGPATDRRIAATDILMKDANGNSRLGTTGNLNFGARMGIQSAGNQTVLELFDGGAGNTCQLAFSNASWLAGIASIAGNLVFQTGGLTERARITDAGNLGIGITSPLYRFHSNLGGNGVAAIFSGITKGVRVNHTASDTRLEGVSHDGASFQPLVIGGSLVSMSESGSITFNFSGGHLLPSSDNTRNLGSGALRMAVIYAGTGTINTSDEREKTDIGAIPEAWLDAWADVQWQRFKMIGGNRWHVGLVAQSVHAAFAAHDLDAFEIGLCCYDKWEEQREAIFETITKTRKATRTEQIAAGENEEGEPLFTLKEVEFDEEYEETVDTGETRVTLEAGDRWGLRYDECQAIEAAWQRREISRLTVRLAALESPST